MKIEKAPIPHTYSGTTKGAKLFGDGRPPKPHAVTLTFSSHNGAESLSFFMGDDFSYVVDYGDIEKLVKYARDAGGI